MGGPNGPISTQAITKMSRHEDISTRKIRDNNPQNLVLMARFSLLSTSAVRLTGLFGFGWVYNALRCLPVW